MLSNSNIQVEIEVFRRELNARPNLNKIGIKLLTPADHFYERAAQRGLTIDVMKKDIETIFIHNLGVLINKLNSSREFTISLGKYSYICIVLEPKRLPGYPNDVYVRAMKFITVVDDKKCIPEMANKTVNLIRELGFEDANKILSEQKFIQVKEYDNFFVYNYNQIFSPEDDDYVMECRSLQIDKFGNVISRAYPRFFNRGQRPEITGKFVFKDCKVMNKVDGSLIRIYYNPYDERWEIATRGTAFAESSQDFYSTFREAVLSDGFGKTEEEFQEFAEENLSPSATYVFEYCSRKNRIVTYYPEPVMYLITMIENSTGKEYDATEESTTCKLFLDWSKNVKLIGYLKFNSIDELLTALENLPDLQEGFVSKDINGLRIKDKNSLYLKCHRLRGDTGFTPKKIATVVVENEQDEVLTYFPEYTDMFVPYIEKFKALMETIRDVWEANKNIESQKDFALAIKDYDFSSLLFNMRKTEKDLATCWNDVRLEFKIGLLIDGDVDE